MSVHHLLVLRDEMLEILRIEQRKRKFDPDWITNELQSMTKAVNVERARLRKPPITHHQMELRERQALGHSDYSSKLALYCAELVLDLPERQ